MALLQVDEALPPGGVRADERHKLARLDTHVCEPSEEHGDGAVSVWKESVGIYRRRARTSDVRVYHRSAGTSELIRD